MNSTITVTYVHLRINMKHSMNKTLWVLISKVSVNNNQISSRIYKGIIVIQIARVVLRLYLISYPILYHTILSYTILYYTITIKE
jgi:hypothetical protein